MSLDNTVNVFILYGCTLSKERSSMRIVAATTDEEMLHTIIGAQSSAAQWTTGASAI